MFFLFILDDLATDLVVDRVVKIVPMAGETSFVDGFVPLECLLDVALPFPIVIVSEPFLVSVVF